jgi:hypothetical protein
MKNILGSVALILFSSTVFAANLIELDPDSSVQVKANKDVTVTCKSSPSGLPLCKLVKTADGEQRFFQIFLERSGIMDLMPLYEYGFYQDSSNSEYHQDTVMTKTLKQLEALRVAKICQ